MDRRLALAAILAVPVLYAVNVWLSGRVQPLVAAGLGLVAYWIFLGTALSRIDRDFLYDLLPLQSPGRPINLALALPVILVGAATFRILGSVILPPHVILAAAMAALLHALLEEMFWRGALIPSAGDRPAALALLLYWIFHAAWLGLAPLEVGVGPALLVLGPLALGGAWTAARLASGTLGSGIMAHASFNLFAFVAIAALAQPAA
ncbi:CPBP family intramembrane metalloprotease [Rubellimicrobium rubrum]|uniref:CPBP family intramembrane metalloprotease n=1 Tax=Rubellimicrobium rubrum TaxID=2585369 RepID=A0A5C4N5F8_9RHOB|nr:CPBP family glutamic-type intramembrane protease [Rubellimicrobium rubrum]TNC51889.1 CPBP family intramembrane metalloprotease [Rubellimicrobium rubrum]